jgi:hypothetical protein
MIVVEVGHAHVITFLPLSCELSVVCCFAPNLTHLFDDFFMWSGNHKFYIQFSRLLRLQSFRITLYLDNGIRHMSCTEKMDFLRIAHMIFSTGVWKIH